VERTKSSSEATRSSVEEERRKERKRVAKLFLFSGRCCDCSRCDECKDDEREKDIVVISGGGGEKEVRWRNGGCGFFCHWKCW
jgi:hypothetical protein